MMVHRGMGIGFSHKPTNIQSSSIVGFREIENWAGVLGSDADFPEAMLAFLPLSILGSVTNALMDDLPSRFRIVVSW